MSMSYVEAAEILRNRDTVGYEEAIEVALRLLDVAADERFAELPCRLGSPFWWINSGVEFDGEPPHVIHNPEDVIEGFLVTRDGVFPVEGSEVADSPLCNPCFYLSREQAESVLAQRESRDGKTE